MITLSYLSLFFLVTSSVIFGGIVALCTLRAIILRVVPPQVTLSSPNPYEPGTDNWRRYEGMRDGLRLPNRQS